MKKHYGLHRHMYLNASLANRNELPESRLKEVMLGASWIHQRYQILKMTFWDRSEKQDVPMSDGSVKGESYFFAVAIQGPKPVTTVREGRVA